MDQLETRFLEDQNLKPLACFGYIDDIFFMWTHSEESLRNFMAKFHLFTDDIKGTVMQI